MLGSLSRTINVLLGSSSSSESRGGLLHHSVVGTIDRELGLEVADCLPQRTLLLEEMVVEDMADLDAEIRRLEGRVQETSRARARSSCGAL